MKKKNMSLKSVLFGALFCICQMFVSDICVGRKHHGDCIKNRVDLSLGTWDESVKSFISAKWNLFSILSRGVDALGHPINEDGSLSPAIVNPDALPSLAVDPGSTCATVVILDINGNPVGFKDGQDPIQLACVTENVRSILHSWSESQSAGIHRHIHLLRAFLTNSQRTGVFLNGTSDDCG